MYDVVYVPILIYTPDYIARHNRRWIDGSIPMVLIDTFGLIFIDVIDPLVKDFLFFMDSIDNG